MCKCYFSPFTNFFKFVAFFRLMTITYSITVYLHIGSSLIRYEVITTC